MRMVLLLFLIFLFFFLFFFSRIVSIAVVLPSEVLPNILKFDLKDCSFKTDPKLPKNPIFQQVNISLFFSFFFSFFFFFFFFFSFSFSFSFFFWMPKSKMNRSAQNTLYWFLTLIFLFPFSFFPFSLFSFRDYVHSP